jgi:hypothetical protein
VQKHLFNPAGHTLGIDKQMHHRSDRHIITWGDRALFRNGRPEIQDITGQASNVTKAFGTAPRQALCRHFLIVEEFLVVRDKML